MQLSVDNQKLLGRYEHTHAGSYKFWQVKYLKDNVFEVSWGRIGNSAQGSNEVNTKELNKKAAEKLKKGYKKVAWAQIDNYHEKIMLETEVMPASLVATHQVEKKKFKI